MKGKRDTMGLHEITASRLVKYLGVRLDEKISYTERVKRVIEKKDLSPI